MANPTDPARLIVVGALAGAHGVRGDVRVRSFTDEAEAIFDFDALLDEAGKPLLKVARYRPASDHFIVTPATPRQKEEWDAMKGVKLHVSRSDLPPADEDEFSSPASKRMKTEKEAKPPDEWSLNLLKQIMEEAGVKKSGTKKELLGRLRDVVAAW